MLLHIAGLFYPRRHDDVAAKTFDRPESKSPSPGRAIESNLYEAEVSSIKPQSLERHASAAVCLQGTRQTRRRRQAAL
jgi:hypothetical protein